ncbi:MAG: HDOD domain-containing protein [Nitrococcus sp.]|nr:HDOD domain-containing protein [Nitrococcus sp.]
MGANERRPSPDWPETASVPVLPPAVGYLLSTLYDEDLSIQSLVTEVERFPSIAGRVLAVANSAWSSPQASITRLPDACVRLGLKLVRTLSIALAVANSFDPLKCQGFDGERHWATALLAAEGATLLANGMGQSEAALTWRSVALLHNIGLLWLADHCPQETSAALLQDTGEGLVAKTQNLMGTDFCSAGAWLARAWGLPEVFPSVIGRQRDPGAAGEHFLAAAAVGIVADMASELFSGDPWTADRVPLDVRAHLRSDLAQSTYQSLSAALEDVQAMGRIIAAS